MANFPVFQGGQLTRGVAVRNERRTQRAEQERKASEDARKRQERIRQSYEDLRLKSLDEFRQFAEIAGRSAEQGVDPKSDVMMKARAGAVASLGSYVSGIQQLKQDIIAKGASEGVPSDRIEEALNAVPDTRAFIQNNMPLFDLAIEAGAEAAPEPVRTLTPEETQAAGFPKGMIVQQRQGGTDQGEFLIKFDPSAAEDDVSSFKEQVDALVNIVGLDEATAVSVKTGQRAISIDPVTRERSVIDLATGEPIGEPEQLPAPPGEAPSLIPEDIETPLATGGPGFVRNVANVFKGAFNADPASPKAQEATEALRTVQVLTETTLQSAVPGRPSVFLLEEFKNLTVTPNSVFQGEPLSKDRLEQTKRLIDGEIARMEQDILPLELDPKTRVDTQVNLTQMKRLSGAYESLLEGFDEQEDETETGFSPEIEALLDKHAPQGQD